jgi:D-alanyl-D-alanine endopeptidase (penicillin-binding protein 7)
MTHRTKTSIIFLSILSLLTPGMGQAIAPNSSAAFNPHFLISDEEMQNYTGMTEGDIQAFLDDHKAYISRLQTPDKDGVVKSTAKIIQEAAQTYRINPKYLLVKLQKEQSLITEDNPTQKQLDWATGYGICDACSMDDPKLQKYRGLGNQIDSAAGIMRWYYDNAPLQSWIKRSNTPYNIDGQTIVPVSMATAFLYTYTPHIQGNQNFWKLWQKWFDQVFPDGTLAKSATNNTIYLIQDGKKRAFTSMSALSTRFNPNLVITVPETELVRYTTLEPITLPNYSILKQGENYYLLDFDVLHPFANSEVVRKLGYNPDEIVDVQPSELTGFTTGSVITTETTAPAGELVRIKETKQLYFIKDGVSHNLMHDSIAKTQFPGLTETVKEISYLQKFTSGDPILFQDGTLIQIKGFPEVYVIEHGQKRHITYEAFMGWGLSFKNLIVIDEMTGIYHPTGQSIFLREGMNPLPTTSAPNDTESPTTQSAGKMFKADTTKFEGKKEFSTSLDTYLVAEYDSGKILAGKNIDFVRPMASLTKVMTGYRLMKENIQMNRSVTYNAKDHKATYGTFRLAEGEKVLNKDLFSAMMISSINTASRMLVDSVEENESAFVRRMNASAKTLGYTKTKFIDVTGEDVGNVSTARDYLEIFQKAINNNDLKTILGAKSYSYQEVLDTDKMPNHFDEHTNSLMAKTFSNFTILASKTGYLDEAGSNLAMLVERKSDKKKFVILSMGNPDYANRFVEPEKLTKWALENF